MAYVHYNPNPNGSYVGDCVIRAISKALNMPWHKTYANLAIQGYAMGDMPSSNRVWGQYLRSCGYRRYVVPNTCPDCYTVKDFCKDNPRGTYLLSTGTHLVCCIDGSYYDAWDSGDETIIYYYTEG